MQPVMECVDEFRTAAEALTPPSHLPSGTCPRASDEREREKEERERREKEKGERERERERGGREGEAASIPWHL